MLHLRGMDALLVKMNLLVRSLSAFLMLEREWHPAVTIFLVFAGNVEETSLIVKKYINFVCKQIKDLKGCEKAEIFRHEFIILVGLPEQHHEPCSYTPSKNDYIPQRVFNDSNYCYCGVHKADPTDKSCCLCSDHLMALIHKSVKEGKIVAGLS